MMFYPGCITMQSRIESIFIFKIAPITPAHCTEYIPPAVVSVLHHKRCAAVPLARVAAVRLAVAGAEHVRREVILGRLPARFSLDNGHDDLFEGARVLFTEALSSPARYCAVTATLREIEEKELKRMEVKNITPTLIILSLHLVHHQTCNNIC